MTGRMKHMTLRPLDVFFKDVTVLKEKTIKFNVFITRKFNFGNDSFNITVDTRVKQSSGTFSNSVNVF